MNNKFIAMKGQVFQDMMPLWLVKSYQSFGCALMPTSSG